MLCQSLRIDLEGDHRKNAWHLYRFGHCGLRFFQSSCTQCDCVCCSHACSSTPAKCSLFRRVLSNVRVEQKPYSGWRALARSITVPGEVVCFRCHWRSCRLCLSRNLDSSMLWQPRARIPRLYSHGIWVRPTKAHRTTPLPVASAFKGRVLEKQADVWKCPCRYVGRFVPVLTVRNKSSSVFLLWHPNVCHSSLQVYIYLQ